MEDEPTQPSTQQVLDPRRIGRNNSGLNEHDVADVLLIMHPASATALRIVENMSKTRGEHVHFRSSTDSMDESFIDIEEQETIIIDRNNPSYPKSRVGADLALRFSSVGILKQKKLGFVFGRNANTADIIFPQDSGRRISNRHFRIYYNNEGVLMLEDMSTNGTIVDDTLLKSKDPKFAKARMLSSGSVICIHNNNDAEMIKFVVRIPSRASHADRYHENLRAFVTECATGADKEKILQRLGGQNNRQTMKWDGGEKYNIIGVVGKGAFATVHQLATKMEGKLLAAKELEKRRFVKNGQLDRKIDNEMKIMESLKHPNIVEYVEYHDEGDFLYIIMEFIHHGDLQTHLSKNGPMAEKPARTMAQQVLNALSYIHRSKITHRDIKPDNILIASFEPLRVKLSDFGLSKVVRGNETFLKTFCGTLLYCAPEVFPDFPSTGKRRRGVKPSNAYSSAVDVWSFGGVLWFALCGTPPFRGVVDATGEAMYKNIMATRLDPTPLREAGVSESCIELLCSMLETDPERRPTAIQCLQHPWLNDGVVEVPPDLNLQSIIEEEEPDEEEAQHQLSQLSIHEEIPESDDEADVLSDEFEKLVGTRQVKRIRKDPLFPRNQLRDRIEDSIDDYSFNSEPAMNFTGEDEESFKIAPGSGRPRLFGEIGTSDIEKSSVMNALAEGAVSHQAPQGEATGQNDATSSHTVGRAQQQHTPSAIRETHQLDGAYSSPSLLGAESMVRELNMASPQSPVSAAHSPNEPETPKTPDVPQHNSLENTSQHPSQISEATPKAKRPALDRQISLPRTASFYYDPYDPTTHNLEYASKVSGIDFIGASETHNNGQPRLDDTMRVSAADSTTSRDSDSGSAVVAAVPSPPADPEIKPPPRRLGKLTATPDSFAPNLILNIDQSRTSWGRSPGNTIVYDDPTEIRISKTSFVIFWYCSDENHRGVVQEMSQQGKDWTGLENLHVGIFTDATSGISINGVHLRKRDDRGRQLFGHLHTGDIIQVFSNARGTDRLKFKCTFYRGSGKDPRPAGENFAIWPRK